jgi:hypothetical protein
VLAPPYHHTWLGQRGSEIKIAEIDSEEEGPHELVTSLFEQQIHEGSLPHPGCTGHGDCEDYAIVKYLALLEAGISKDDAKIVILEHLSKRRSRCGGIPCR